MRKPGFKDWSAYIEKDISRQVDRLHLMYNDGDKYYRVCGFKYEEYEPFSPLNSEELASTYMEPGLLQALMDEMWNKGYRPSNYYADLDAQKKHLEDMRRLVFDK